MDFILGGLIGLVLGVVFSKGLRNFWRKFKTAPALTIQNEINELKAYAAERGIKVN